MSLFVVYYLNLSVIVVYLYKYFRKLRDIDKGLIKLSKSSFIFFYFPLLFFYYLLLYVISQPLNPKTMKKAAIKAYYPNELAELYGLSYKQFFARLEDHRDRVPKKQKRMLSPSEVEYIFSVFGRPDAP